MTFSIQVCFTLCYTFNDNKKMESEVYVWEFILNLNDGGKQQQ